MTEVEPDPREQMFAALRDLRARVGDPSLREIAENSGGGVSHSSVSRVFRGEVLPRFGLLKAIVTSLGGDVDTFRSLHQRAEEAGRTLTQNPNLSERFVISVRCPYDVGIPLQFAAWFMTTVSETFPNTVVVDVGNQAPLAVAISWDDLRALDDVTTEE